ncbi:hypothetical protein VQ042_22575 [Aurantimonas sp. A2-1-M11]|uniref:hypothetical protein n=1 Tax=Aurantimonas sp. A2-1-M11 TaxID=3113712 RepID=UPI002F946FDC
MPNGHVLAAAEGLPDTFDNFDTPTPLADLIGLVAPTSDGPDAQLVAYANTLRYLIRNMESPTSPAALDADFDRASEIVRLMSDQASTTPRGVAAKGFAAAWSLLEFRRDGTPFVDPTEPGVGLLASLYGDVMNNRRMGE